MKRSKYLIVGAVATLAVITAISLLASFDRDERLRTKQYDDMTELEEAREGVRLDPGLVQLSQLSKAVFFLENSASMFGYINGFPEYVDVVSELAEKPEFVEHKISREFFFVNGGAKLHINRIGDSPEYLKTKLNEHGYRCGDISKSNLNGMFQLALSKAKHDTISILISDAIYDIGQPQAPMNALATEGRETRSRFIERLSEGHLQTIIIKLTSSFNGYYYPVTGGRSKINQQRPFYIWIFGDSKLLNKYFPDSYINSLKGFTDVARFLITDEVHIPYQVTAHNTIGRFRFDKKNKNKLVNAETDKHGRGFQFTLAVNYSGLPFSDSYYNNPENYYVSNPNYTVTNVCNIGDIKLFGLPFTPTHLITLSTDKHPTAMLKVSLLNNVPNWIEETNIDEENSIVGDTTHTFGFKFLTEAIVEAYQHIDKKNTIETFSIEIKR